MLSCSKHAASGLLSRVAGNCLLGVLQCSPAINAGIAATLAKVRMVGIVSICRQRHIHWIWRCWCTLFSYAEAQLPAGFQLRTQANACEYALTVDGFGCSGLLSTG